MRYDLIAGLGMKHLAPSALFNKSQLYPLLFLFCYQLFP